MNDNSEWISMSDRQPTEADFVKDEWAVEFLLADNVRFFSYGSDRWGMGTATHWHKVQLCSSPIICPFKVGDHIRLKDQSITCSFEDMVITSIDDGGASYKGAIPVSIPRMGIQSDGTGKIFPNAYRYYELRPSPKPELSADKKAWMEFAYAHHYCDGPHQNTFYAGRRTMREEIGKCFPSVYPYREPQQVCDRIHQLIFIL
jgi:hypothetical protein